MAYGESSDVGRGKVIHSANVDFLRRSGGVWGRIGAIAMALCRIEAVVDGLRIRYLYCLYLHRACCETYLVRNLVLDGSQLHVHVNVHVHICR